MSSLMYNNSSQSLDLNNNFRTELIQYIAKVNYILLFIQAFICIMGVLGNLLVLIVINRKSLRNTSAAVFITYMAIFDITVLLLHAANIARTSRNLILHCSLTYLTDLSTFCANWVLVIITLERCVAVYSPFLAKRFCTIHSARYSIYILLAIAITFFSATFPFIYEISETSKSKKCRIHLSHTVIIRIYQPILFYAIPDLFLLSNFFTVFALCRRRHRLSSAYLNDENKSEIRITDINSNRKQRQLTIMLVTVSLSFYVFSTPAIISYILAYYPPTNKELNKIKIHFLFSQITVVLLQLNNATNFIFYCFTGQRFRRATKQIFYDYSVGLRTFYHRYILCDKQYNSARVYQYQLSNMANTTVTTRTSTSPYNHRHQHQYRNSTI